MRTRFGIFLLIVGCMGESYASTADTPTSSVRAQRAEYNAAIAAHDAVRLRTFFVDDYHLILGSSGDVDSGADAATRGYAEEDFKDPTFVTYRRTPTSIVIAASGKRIAETGRFEGIWRKPDGTMRKTGIYLAMWIPSAGAWRLKSEAFVTLAGAHAAAFSARFPASHRQGVWLGGAAESDGSFPLTDGGHLPADKMLRAAFTSLS